MPPPSIRSKIEACMADVMSDLADEKSSGATTVSISHVEDLLKIMTVKILRNVDALEKEKAKGVDGQGNDATPKRTSLRAENEKALSPGSQTPVERKILSKSPSPQNVSGAVDDKKSFSEGGRRRSSALLSKNPPSNLPSPPGATKAASPSSSPTAAPPSSPPTSQQLKKPSVDGIERVQSFKRGETGGAPSSPPPSSNTKHSSSISKAPPVLPKSVLAKARETALKNNNIKNSNKNENDDGNNDKGDDDNKNTKNLDRMDSAGSVSENLPVSGSPSTIPARDRIQSSTTRRDEAKKRIIGSGGVAMFNPGIGALGKGGLKKVEGVRERKEEVRRSFFERPQLNKVNRPSAKNLVQEQKKVARGGPRMSVTKEGEEEEEEERRTSTIVGLNNVVGGDHDWEERFDEESDAYYYFNKITHESSWEKPEKFVPHPSREKEEAKANDDEKGFVWEQRWEPTHKLHYYFNLTTGESVWEPPQEGFKPLEGSGEEGGEGKKEGGGEQGGGTEGPVENTENKDAAGSAAGAEQFVWEQRWEPTHNLHYYFNTVSGESVWEPPQEGFKPLA